MHQHAMKTIALSDGERVPVLGQGTWRMGENARAHKDEVTALRLGIELGMTLIDTADVRRRRRGRSCGRGDRGPARLRVRCYQGVSAQRFTYGITKACARSLKRLRIDAIDLYLLHWRERNTRLEETVEAFEKLRSTGKIKRWGISNFDVDDMQELWSVENGTNCAANQVLYNLVNRQIEFDLLPLVHQSSTVNDRPIMMAYSPVGHGRGLLENLTLKEVAKRHERTTSQIALAWVLCQPGMIAIPKASNEKHVRDNARSIEIKLTSEDFADLDREFPAPKSKRSLPML